MSNPMRLRPAVVLVTILCFAVPAGAQVPGPAAPVPAAAGPAPATEVRATEVPEQLYDEVALFVADEQAITLANLQNGRGFDLETRSFKRIEGCTTQLAEKTQDGITVKIDSSFDRDSQTDTEHSELQLEVELKGMLWSLEAEMKAVGTTTITKTSSSTTVSATATSPWIPLNPTGCIRQEGVGVVTAVRTGGYLSYINTNSKSTKEVLSTLYMKATGSALGQNGTGTQDRRNEFKMERVTGSTHLEQNLGIAIGETITVEALNNALIARPPLRITMVKVSVPRTSSWISPEQADLNQIQDLATRIELLRLLVNLPKVTRGDLARNGPCSAQGGPGNEWRACADVDSHAPELSTLESYYSLRKQARADARELLSRTLKEQLNGPFTAAFTECAKTVRKPICGKTLKKAANEVKDFDTKHGKRMMKLTNALLPVVRVNFNRSGAETILSLTEKDYLFPGTNYSAVFDGVGESRAGSEGHPYTSWTVDDGAGTALFFVPQAGCVPSGSPRWFSACRGATGAVLGATTAPTNSEAKMTIRLFNDNAKAQGPPDLPNYTGNIFLLPELPALTSRPPNGAR